jgi:hypothetical protein
MTRVELPPEWKSNRQSAWDQRIAEVNNTRDERKEMLVRARDAIDGTLRAHERT